MRFNVGDRVEFVGHIVESGDYTTKRKMDQRGITQIFGTIHHFITYNTGTPDEREEFKVNWDDIGDLDTSYKPNWLKFAKHKDFFEEDFTL